MGIKQGGLGDCWLLGAISAFSEVPERITDNLFVNPEQSTNGVYRFKFWVKDKWVYVNVNDELPY